MEPKDPEAYVENNSDILVRLIKHSSDSFVRSLALAALLEYGGDATVEEVRADLTEFCNRRDK